ncbi:N-acetylmuramoyl-L-alanine amidase-like domain-containing protein [Croceitalea sp. P059]|uniref:N-acetylmuramoyl-L-alanine amidase-like domain-containing protein n=1 Tax=Croceitalea sp. P059 TaxID=3075601 RepID=UPI00288512F8|nr:N-acetylmuramoyl-L-alanine amidase-like domain-containing protein [Croceitalea sp. P059]MDT0538838.1 DUF1460 domain-containing protein [Croceitalea sp. P059]
MKYYLLLLNFLLVHFVTAQIVSSAEDEAIFKTRLLQIQDVETSSFNEHLLEVGKTFLGTPYVEKTLEFGKTEALVINFRGLDCTTFVENTLAISLLQKQEKTDFFSFTDNLKTIRYRNGILDGYSSRLHYFTDWIRNNEEKGLVKDITADLGGIELNKSINFMGTHRELYPFLSDDTNYQRIIETETSLAKKTLCYLPQKEIKKSEAYMKSGDIIALATSIKGLDVTHTGIAFKKPNGRIHLLHASSSGEVKITEVPLVDYLKKVKNNIGIIVARPMP